MSEKVFIVDPTANQLVPVESVSFAEIGVKERHDLEVWVTSHPASATTGRPDFSLAPCSPSRRRA
jgi:hypothetical protein